MDSRQLRQVLSSNRREILKAALLLKCGSACVSLLFALNGAVMAAEQKPDGKPQKPSTHSCCQNVKIAEANQSAGDADKSKAPARKEVLDPGQFPGMASFGYASAKACPEVMEKLFCYCGCDLTDSHTSLLDCFTSMHGIDCHICQEEALLANKMHKDGTSIADIQKEIDEKYSKEYPFEQDTPAYKKYKSTRLWVKDGAGSQVKFGTQVAGPEAPKETPASTNPKLKPGKEVGKCCSGDEHSKKNESKKDDSKKDESKKDDSKKSDSKKK